MNPQDKHIEERIKFYIKNKFYYLEYPKGVGERIWKDRNGKYNLLEEMGMDHLMASVKLIEKDMNSYDNMQIKDIAHKSVRDVLFPMATNKIFELKKEINSRIESV